MAEPKQSSLSEEKTSVIGNSKEEKQSMVHEKETHGRSEDIDDKTSVIGNSKEEKQSMVHEKETHGRSEDIDEKTRVDDVKGPGFIERMKEEMEAIVDAVTPNKSSDNEDETPVSDDDSDPNDFLTPSRQRLLRERPVKPSTKVKEMQWQPVAAGRGNRGRGKRGCRG